MSSFTEFAYNIAEKAFKTPPGNKKTMATVASKGRWLFIISAFVAAAADDANLRGPARDALAPQDLDLAGEPNPQEAPAPRDAERRDVPPADAEAAPVAGRAGPLVTRHLALEGVLQDDGWTFYQGMRLQYEVRGFEDVGSRHLPDCKQSCLERDWCRGIHFSEDEDENDNCSLLSVAAGDAVDITMDSWFKYYKYDSCSPQTYGELVATETTSHYVAPTGQELVDARRELGYINAMQELQDNISSKTWLKGQVAQHLKVQEVQEIVEEIARQECVSAGVGDDGTRIAYLKLGPGANTFLPYCDVSERRDFRYMFLGTESTADISQWNVEKGTSFYKMFTYVDEFNRDLSRWTIRYHDGEPTNKLGQMLTGTGIKSVYHCPCIEQRDGDHPWLQFCPGKRDLGSVPCNKPN